MKSEGTALSSQTSDYLRVPPLILRLWARLLCIINCVVEVKDTLKLSFLQQLPLTIIILLNGFRPLLDLVLYASS